MNHAVNDVIAAPEHLARRMIPTVHAIASRLARRLPRHIAVDDLVGAGYQGLCAALRRFDPDRVEAFDAYAERRIRGAMLDELRSNDLLSRDRRAQAKRTAAATRALQARLGRAPSAEEIADELGIALETFWTWQAANTASVVQAPPGSADGDVLADLSDAEAEAADERVSRLQREDALRAAMASLPPRLQRILEAHYIEGMTLQQIGQELGVTESRVCQLESDAVKRLRDKCSAHVGSGDVGSSRAPLAA
jgi:RNA polymerase sigma factor for flagellar operon FliA